MPEPLPIDPSLPAIAEAVETAGAAVVCAPVGAGKTTRVPPALLDAVDGRIVMLEPRRVAARAAARRMAAEQGWRLGGKVGYQIRFDRLATDGTRILVVTEGILARMLLGDPLLEGIGAVILDEFHERSIHADLALAMTRYVRREARSDLAILVMSATIDAGPVARFLGGCPVIEVEGRSHEVEIIHLDRPASLPLLEQVVGGVEILLERTGGDILVFLPGVGEIRGAEQRLARMVRDRNLHVMPLYGDLPAEDQDRVLEPGTGRKIVLATNVAETSLTIPGVTGVVDSGLARVLRYDPSVGLDRLETVRIGRASAEQRAGRAGRTAPGKCLRLWTRTETARMRPGEDPEIRRVDLAGPVLDLLAWGEDPAALGWLDPPDPGAVERATRLLENLGALRNGRITERGRAMARLPLHPRLSRLVMETHGRGHLRSGCLLAALLSERDPVRRSPGPRRSSSRSDVLDRLAAVRSGEDSNFEAGEIDRRAVASVRRTADHLERSAMHSLGGPCPARGDEEEVLLSAILAAYPDRVCLRREPRSDRGVMVGGRGVRVDQGSSVVEPELFVAVDVVPGRRGQLSEALVRQASEARVDWLDGKGISTAVENEIDPGGRVRAVERTRYHDLAIRESERTPDPDAAREILLARVRRDPTVLGLDDEPLRTFLARVRFLARVMPELGLPSFDEDHVASLLPLVCTGLSSLAEVRGSAAAIFGAALTHGQIRSLDREAPERIAVPGGSRIAIDYAVDGPPVLAARIQEVFGMKETPSIAGGRVPLVLHLLAPNMRPQQVTQDLASFWKNTYPEVRRELRGRYPRHSWPEDPIAARPSRPGRRKR